jgi:hypothetical protein
MTSITLKYDERNPAAQDILDYILSSGVFERMTRRANLFRRKTGIEQALDDVRQSRLRTVHVKGNPFAESDDDIANGRVYTAKDADDLIRQCLGS